MSFPNDELQRIHSGPQPQEEPGSTGLMTIEAKTSDPELVLERCRSALLTVAEGMKASWPIDRWEAELPEWLTDRFVTADEKDALSPEATAAFKAAKGPEARLAALDVLPWTIANWLYWFEAEQREWWWWDSEATAADRLTIRVVISDVVVAWDALRLLIRTAGAETVDDVA